MFWPCLFCGWSLSIFFLFSCSCLMVSGSVWLGIFQLCCNNYFRKNENASDLSFWQYNIPQHPASLSPLGIHTLGVASSLMAKLQDPPQLYIVSVRKRYSLQRKECFPQYRREQTQERSNCRWHLLQTEKKTGKYAKQRAKNIVVKFKKQTFCFFF